MMAAGCVSRPHRAVLPTARNWFVGFTNFGGFSIGTNSDRGQWLVLESPEIKAPIAWDELVASWNVAPGTVLKTEARAIFPGAKTKYYTLGLWSDDTSRHPRASVSGQGDAYGTVKTDTLVLSRHGGLAQVRLTLGSTNRDMLPALKYLALSFCNSAAAPRQPQLDTASFGSDLRSPRPTTQEWGEGQGEGKSQRSFFAPLPDPPPARSSRGEGENATTVAVPSCAAPKPAGTNHPDWGKVLDVPERRQAEYDGGMGWCSPTAVSMVMAYWAALLSRPELDRTVPETAAAVYDSELRGTGNWPFNTAYAGAFPGMRAYVTRLDDLSELEPWINAGIPPVLSVSSYLTNDRHGGTDSGHLIVCVGFTANGDVVANNPGVSVKKGIRARQVYPRERVIEAWKKSKNTVYFIYPESAKIPENVFGHW